MNQSNKDTDDILDAIKLMMGNDQLNKEQSLPKDIMELTKPIDEKETHESETSILELSDIVISSSTDPEAFGRVSIEAQAMGKIIIASNHGGSQETIIEGKTGYLYSPKKPIELMEKILYTIAQKKYCSTDISELAMNHIRNNYGKDKMCERTLEFYQKIIN